MTAGSMGADGGGCVLPSADCVDMTECADVWGVSGMLVALLCRIPSCA